MEIKRILTWFIAVVFVVLILVGISMRSKMNNYVSELMKKQAGEEIALLGAAYVDSVFNYRQNDKDFRLTFLEFGARGCSACKRMESVMEEVKQKQPKVNVVYLNVLLPENQLLMKYYGIATIPTQVLLNGSGKEYFRHDGYLPYRKLINEFDKKQNQKLSH